MAEAFLCIGAMKSGTTSIYELLRGHPAVDVVAEKEASELLGDHTASRLARRVGSSPAVVAGEVTAGYMQAPIVEQPVHRAIELLGSDLQLLAILRDPFARAVSHWEHWSHLGRETRPLEQALVAPDSPYVAFSKYAEQLRPWRDVVSDDQIHLIKLEDYQQDPEAISRALWNFLGVPDQGARDAEPVHANAGEERVVAAGPARRLSLSPVYRRLLRPLVPTGARRAVASALGGARGRVAAAPRHELREQFAALVHDDRALLEAGWPDRTWW